MMALAGVEPETLVSEPDALTISLKILPLCVHWGHCYYFKHQREKFYCSFQSPAVINSYK